MSWRGRWAAVIVVVGAQALCAVQASATTGPDLAITKTDGVTSATPGGTVTYTITAANTGASNATGATVADTFPASETGTYTAVGAGGATGFTSSGTGNINDTVNLPAGASVTYTVSVTINPSATGSVSNTATVTFPGDPNTANNSATDTDTLTPKRKATSLRLSTSVNPVVVGRQVTYTARVSPAPDGGRVSFLQDGRMITGCTNIRVSKAGTATCRRIYGRAGAGAHTIQARYTGTAHFGNSRSNKLTEIVKRRQ